jgi:steroid 5-alpha reductase family enzyme
MDRGLWKYTRHPNYFGDACVWWGIALVAAETTVGRWGLIGAVAMTVLLRKVSGVPLLEKSLVKRRAGYEEYVARTSPFLPRPPKTTT